MLANVVGLGLGVLAYVVLHFLGIYMAIVSNYLIYMLTLIAFWFSERWSVRSINVLVIGLFLILTIVSSCAVPIPDPPITWPLAQLISMAILLMALYLVKPLPKALINQVPGFARPLITPFIKTER
ncbi:hypothetical protein [Vulcanisaeta distributa]|uniref:hypothetical protein n=1 Tax=Vulcanisaeta distributa TaxID=164451 RepID=UPI001FB3B1E6|nr:hypothetical protein [Vulcanisaeta distributa]